MKRRSFLGLLGGAIAAPAVKAEPTQEVKFTTPEMSFATDRTFVSKIPFLPYEPDLVRFAVRDEDGRIGYVLQGQAA